MSTFDAENPNLTLWLREETTDPRFVKPITGKSYSGTSPNPTYLVKRLTAAFGPVGFGWGYTARFEDVQSGSGTVTNFCHLTFWYYPFGRSTVDGSGVKAEFDQVGGTTFAGTYSSGKAYADDDARKKSLTDAIVKAASHIGFAGDIFLGRYDDQKYVEGLKEEVAAKTIAAERAAQDKATRELLQGAAEIVADLIECDSTGYTELRDKALKLWPALQQGGHQDAITGLTDAMTGARKRLGIPDPAPRQRRAA